MKVLRLHAPYDLRLHDEPVPDICPREVLVQVKSVGICASDAHWYREGRIGTTVMTEPLVLGHEVSGEIAAVASDVTNVRPGDRVAIEPARHCGGCKYCHMGEINVCPTVQFMGTPPTDGAFREYLAWPADLVIPIPESLSFDEAAMAEPLAVGVFAVDLAEFRGGESIAILGAGAIGLSVLQAAKLAGVGDAYVSDPVPERRDAAKRLGATDVFHPDELASALLARTQYGPDVVFECAGDPAAIRQAGEVARTLGKMVIVGIPDEDEYTFPASASRRKQLKAIFVRRSKGTTERALEMAASGHADVVCYATHRFPLERVADAFDLVISKKDGVIRTLVDLSSA